MISLPAGSLLADHISPAAEAHVVENRLQSWQVINTFLRRWYHH